MLFGTGLLLAATAAQGQLSPREIETLRKRGEAEGWTFRVGENDATRRPLEELCGLVVPDRWWVDAPFDPMGGGRGLPDAFNWCDFDGCTPVRNQGGCGSCWAFAAVGPVECNILIRDGHSVDLSEQWLVSCTDAGSCNGGWHSTAFEYYLDDGPTDPCGDNGAVLEEYFPYVAWDAPCECPYPHDYYLNDWAFIGDDNGVAPPHLIKQAILEHGPVGVAVSVNSAFQAYNGGVFNSHSDGQINHAVTLVGWDDTQGAGGVWYLRNSWGTGWGEDGYMRIEYGCSRVGYAAAYVDYGDPDCNGNGVPDDEDIANGTSMDCNENGRPDECDLLYGTSPDINGNGVPDECEACVTALQAPDGAGGEHFGGAVAVDGTVALIGAYWDGDNGDSSGSAYIYRYDDGAWDEEIKLVPSDGAADDRFGRAVAVHGDLAVIGASGDDDHGECSGAAYVYRFDGDAWIEQAKLLPTEGAAFDHFGYSVAVHDDLVVVGARGPSDGAGHPGFASIYRYDGSSWQEEATVSGSGGGGRDYFGYSVAVAEDLAVVGAIWDEENGEKAGAAYAYRFDESSWTEEEKLLASDGAEGDWFGSSVSISGDTVLVGASWEDHGAQDIGAAYVYRHDGSDWGEEEKLVAFDGSAGDYFGSSASISGDLVIVGAPRDNDMGDDSGSAYVYFRDGGGWTLASKALALDGTAGDRFGSAIALSNGNALIGAGAIDTAYIFGDVDGDDCNGNGTVDACDILAGNAFDCNNNFVPDVCDIADGTSEDENENGIPDECECPGDVNGDELVNVADLLFLLGAWGDEGGPADINQDGIVNADDLLMLLAGWGECP
ncbi:MAG: C1 family peptidase [Planctomycetota bacterium]|nr:C1 family peptidase [Planctomycetota bacterium]